MQRTNYLYAFFDLNSYFASVEQQERPGLRGKPVAVVPMMTDYTCAIAASYEAKAYGIKTGTRIKEAKEMCPGLQCVLARHDIYVQYHHRIIGEVVKHIPISKICSVDELSSRLPPDMRTKERSTQAALRLKEGLTRNVGVAIKCSIGIAPNSFLAKVATDMQKPDGLVVLDRENLPDALYRLNLRDLPGINKKMEYRLWKSGISTIKGFMDLPPKQARSIWGSVLGERLWYRLHGYDVEDPPTKKSVIGHSRVLEPDLRKPVQAMLMARKLTVKAASRLRREDFYATMFDLAARDTDGNKWAAGVRISPQRDNFALLKHLDVLWDQMVNELQPKKLLLVGVNLHGLCRSEEITPDLFDQSSSKYQEIQTKRDALTSAMDKINRRFGADTVQLGTVPPTQAGYVGTKISFTRVPELGEFYE